MAGEEHLVSGVAGRYATALFDLARDANTIDAVKADLDRFDTFLNTSYPLLTYDKNTWIDLSNRALTSSDVYRTLLEAINMAKKNAEEALMSLKKEYHFK